MKKQLTGKELIEFLETTSPAALKEALEYIHPADILDAMEDYDGDFFNLLVRIPTDILAGILEEAEEEDKGELLGLFSTDQKVDIISEMASDEVADMMEHFDDDEVNELISSLDEEKAQEIKQLMSYDPETAGGIMATEFVPVNAQMTVKDTLEYLQKNGEDAETINYLYMLDPDDKLKGVVSLRDIVMSEFNLPLTELVNPNVVSVPTNMDQEEVAQLFRKYGFSAIPVVDENHKMLGIITADDVLDVVVDESTEDFERMSALSHSETEYLDSSVMTLARKRIFWLLFLMISATFTGIVIQRYESALAIDGMLILVAFIPMLMDTGGNAGSQSATLVIRGMALGEISIKDFFVVLFKEIRVSLVVGLALSVVNLLRIWMFNKDLMLGLSVSIAMFFTVIIANVVGGTLPLIARKFKLDPAIMAAPIITTIVDVLALIVYFSVAMKLYNPA
ncbi:MAG: magnesium transporter [Candidatus Cloacimonetes bacterium]|nr:magnesium transporter [Candidatus Cloacimonadota bacterium]